MTIIALNSVSESRDTLRIAFPTKQVEIDPQKIEDMYSMTLVNQLYAKLFRYTPDGQIRPDLVEKWATSKDKTTYTFNLKKMTFSDGTPITARHVELSLKRIFVLKSSLASDLSLIKGADTFEKTKNPEDLKISAVDNLTLTIQTSAPTSLLIYLLAVPDVGVLKIDTLPNKLDIQKTSAFSGPYRIRSISSESIVVEKWRSSDLESEHPPQEIVFNLFNNIDPDKLASGTISDTSNFMTFDNNRSPLKDNANWKSVASEATNERFIVMNPTKIPVTVRKWLLSQVNPKDFVALLGDKSIEPAFGFIPNFLPGHLKKSPLKKMLPLKLEKPFSLKISYGDNLPYPDKFKEYLTTVWSHPKLILEFEVLPVATYLNLMFKKKGSIIVGARGLDYPEGYSTITYFKSNIESNYLFVNSKEIDSLITQASHEVENEKRYKLYENIQNKVLENATVIPLAFGSWKKYYWSMRVKSVPAHPIGVHFIPLEMLTMGGS